MDNFASMTAERVSDKALHVEFYTDALLSGYKSEQAGHPVFDDIEMIRIITPGDSKTIIETKVDETHIRRFGEAYKRFKAGLLNTVSGWALKEWPVITASQVKLLDYHNVKTVEQLSTISDQACNTIGMGIMELRTKAKAALEAAKGQAETSAQATRMQRQDEEIASLKAQLEAINAAAIESAKRGPGRPPKE